MAPDKDLIYNEPIKGGVFSPRHPGGGIA